jgi:hypothetical protein
VILFLSAWILAAAPVAAGPDVAAAAAQAIASQTDPQKLKTLRGERASNPRLNRCVYWLAAARNSGADPEAVLAQAARLNKTIGTPRAEFVRWGLMENLKIADDYGLLGPEGMKELKRGKGATITRGPYAGEAAEVDHVIPRAVCPELGNEVMNLELLAAKLNRSKRDNVTARAVKFARELYEAGLLSAARWEEVKSRGPRKGDQVGPGATR